MVGHVLGVPVALQPVLGGVLLDKVADAVAEVVGLEQQKLDDEVADLRLIAFMATHGLLGRDNTHTHTELPQTQYPNNS